MAIAARYKGYRYPIEVGGACRTFSRRPSAAVRGIRPRSATVEARCPQSYLEPILLADRIAAEAARLLDQAMNSTVTGTAHIALKPELIVRQSTARHASAVAV